MAIGALEARAATVAAYNAATEHPTTQAAVLDAIDHLDAALAILKHRLPPDSSILAEMTATTAVVAIPDTIEGL